MTVKEPGNTWLLVRANLLEEEDRVAVLMAKWQSTKNLDEISWSELLLLTKLYNKWSSSSSMHFDPRITGNAKRTFYHNTRYSKAIVEIDKGMSSAKITHAWMRESGLLHYNLSPLNSLYISQLDMLYHVEDVENIADVLASLGWRKGVDTNTSMVFSNQENSKLQAFPAINPHWTPKMHGDLISFIRQDGSGIGVLIEILSRIELDREEVDWVRICEGMIILKRIKAANKLQLLIRLGGEYFVLNPLKQIYQYLLDVFEHDIRIDLNPSAEEEQLHKAYSYYMQKRSKICKAKYHLARYRAINILSSEASSPLNYIIKTYASRRLS